MAIATVAAFDMPSPSRRAAAASAQRVPPRVYSPFGVRRLPRPMAVRADAEGVDDVPRPRWPFMRPRRGTGDRSGSA